VLAICSLFAGCLDGPTALEDRTVFAQFLEPVSPVKLRSSPRKAGRAIGCGSKEEEHTSPTEYLLMFCPSPPQASGSTCRRAYGKADKGYTEPIATAAPPVYNTLLNKYYVDEGYDLVFTGRRKSGDVRLGVLVRAKRRHGLMPTSSTAQ